METLAGREEFHEKYGEKYDFEEEKKYYLKEQGDEIVDKQLAEWRFYLPDKTITDRILLVSENMNESYRTRKNDNLYESEKDRLFEDIPEDHWANIEKNLKDDGWFERLLNSFIGIVFRGDREEERPIVDEDYAFYFQKFVAEKMYNHMAMLARTDHAIEGGSFSLQEEFTCEIAPKLGLELCLREETPGHMRAEAIEALSELATEFEHWLVHIQHGYLETMFGYVCSDIYKATHTSITERLSGLLVLKVGVQAQSASG